jgi:hypothetical protein
MGWMSWERFRCEVDCVKNPNACINENLYMAMTDHIASDGYLEAGYNQVSIDDCWEQKVPMRDAQGKLAPNSTRFPSGMKALGDYMHKKGVNFGIYSDEGTKTCGGYPGSKGYEEIDAKTFAEWGVDYLKLDGCNNDKASYFTGYPAMGTALQASGRNISYSCSWPAYIGSDESVKPWDAMIAAGCNSWRNWDDIQNRWSSVANIIDHWGDYSVALQKAAGPGHWNDMDMILAGDDHQGKGFGPMLTPAESQTQLTIWSIMASPLIMSSDLRTVNATFKTILLNKDMIQVSQDPLGKAGVRVGPKTSTQVWVRELQGGDVAVALYNKGDAAAKISVKVSDLGLSIPSSNKYKFRDIWVMKEGVVSGDGTLSEDEVPAHGVAFFRLTKQ